MILLALAQRLFSIVSLCLLGAGGYLVWSWWDREGDVRAIDPDLDPSNARLYIGLALLAWSFFGRLPLLMIAAKPARDHDRFQRAEGRMITGADGSNIRVESYGPPDAPCLVLTHGWGMNSTIWIDAKRQLAKRYRLVVWDLPGLGRSRQPAGRAYSLDGFAADLRAVIADSASRGPVLLVGHSIGGMTVQTFCRNYPEMLGAEVAGVVLENTTHTNPIRTMALGGLLRPLQKPLLEPMMKLDILLAPVLWLINWHGYLSGSNHLAARLVGFGSRPTTAQLDQTARLMAEGSPAVQARGNLAMMHWSVTDDLFAIRTPALVFIGQRDLITLPHAGEHIASAMPEAWVVSVDQAGHMGPVECATDYNRAIAAFADKVLMPNAVPADGRPSVAEGRETLDAEDAEDAQRPPEPRPN